MWQINMNMFDGISSRQLFADQLCGFFLHNFKMSLSQKRVLLLCKTLCGSSSQDYTSQWVKTLQTRSLNLSNDEDYGDNQPKTTQTPGAQWIQPPTDSHIHQALIWKMLSSTSCTDVFHTWKTPGALWGLCSLISPVCSAPSNQHGSGWNWRVLEWTAAWLQGPPTTSPIGNSMWCFMTVWCGSLQHSGSTLTLPVHPIHIRLQIQHWQLPPPDVLRQYSHRCVCISGDWRGVEQGHHQFCRLVWTEPPAHHLQQDKEVVEQLQRAITSYCTSEHLGFGHWDGGAEKIPGLVLYRKKQSSPPVEKAEGLWCLVLFFLNP